MYCKDCKFYKYDRTDDIIDEKTYEVIKEIKRGTCNNSNLRYAWELEDESQLMYHDSVNYSAALYVGELFGCVHFKEKQPIQSLLRNIEIDLKCLFKTIKNYKRISEDKWINKDKYNSYHFPYVRMECDQLVHDCKMLLEEIEIHETRSK